MNNRLRTIELLDLGAVGAWQDAIAVDAPINMFYDCEGVRFVDKEIQKMRGRSAASAFGTLVVTPYWLLPFVDSSGAAFMVVTGLTKVYVVTLLSGTTTNITRQTAGVDVNYTGAATDLWTGGVLNGVPIVNNGIDVPQMWLPATVGTKLAALSNWPVNTYCKIIRPFGNYLVALDITKATGTRYPYMVKWSAVADPGTVPPTWDETDVTQDAGEQDLAADIGYYQEAKALGDTMFLYKDFSVWRMNYVGGTQVFAFRRAFSNFGALNPNCVVEIDGFHVVLGHNDVIVHDGTSQRSILSGKNRKKVFSTINSSNKHLVFLLKKDETKEVYICYPEGATVINAAIIWNAKDDTQYYRHFESPYPKHGTQSLVKYSGSSQYYATQQIVMCDSTPRLFADDIPKPYSLAYLAGGGFIAFVEKRDITILDENGTPDLTTWKQLQRVYLRLTAETTGVVVTVAIYTQQLPGDTPVLASYANWTIGTTKYLDFLVTAPLFTIRIIDADGAYEWALRGMQLQMASVGIAR